MRSLRKTVPFVTLLFLVGIVAVSGCSPVKTPVPTPDIVATVEAAVAVALASQPTPDVAATVEAAVATKMAATQIAQAEPAATPTPVPPTATPKPADTPTVGPTDTPIPTDTPTAKPTETTQAEPACAPTIEFTHVPPYKSEKDLQGRVTCVEPAAYKVAVYIYVWGWYNKPWYASPLTTIGSDGTWTTDITIAENDPLATKIAAFLVPNGYDPPVIKGDQALPEGLSDNAVDHVRVDRPKPDARTIEFSGYT
jgi:hypothetical protein